MKKRGNKIQSARDEIELVEFEDYKYDRLSGIYWLRKALRFNWDCCGVNCDLTAGLGKTHYRILRHVQRGYISYQTSWRRQKSSSKKGSQTGWCGNIWTVYDMLTRNYKTKLIWSNTGIKVEPKKLSIRRFADDILLFSDTKGGQQDMTEEQSRESLQVGLKIIKKKTSHVQRIWSYSSISHRRGVLERVNNCIYLGPSGTDNSLTSRK